MCTIYFFNLLDLIRDLSNALQSKKESESSRIIFIGVYKEMNKSHTSLYIHSFEFDCPSFKERQKFIQFCIGTMNISADVSITELAMQTAGFLFEDFRNMFQKARIESCLVLQDAGYT